MFEVAIVSCHWSLFDICRLYILHRVLNEKKLIIYMAYRVGCWFTGISRSTTSGSNNFNDFPENQLTKCRAV